MTVATEAASASRVLLAARRQEKLDAVKGRIDQAGAELPRPRDDCLQPKDLAETALFCVAMPQRVQMDNLVLWPVCEPTA